MRFNRKIFAVASLLVCLSLFCGCAPDYGDLNDIDVYQSAFSVKTIDNHLAVAEFSASQVFSEDTVNNFHCEIPFAQYLYMFVRINRAFAVEEFKFYVQGTNDIPLDLSFEVYILDNIPSKIKDSDGNTASDGDSSEDESPDIGDEPFNGKIASGNVSLSDDWCFVNADNWIDGNKSVIIDSGKFLAVKFINNCFFDAEHSHSADLPTARTKCSLRITNLFFRAFFTE